MHGMRVYNLEGQWMCEEASDDECELATLDEDSNYGLVTGQP